VVFPQYQRPSVFLPGNDVVPEEALEQTERRHPERKSRKKTNGDERSEQFIGHFHFSYAWR
jgi:hypothetical protein